MRFLTDVLVCVYVCVYCRQGGEPSGRRCRQRACKIASGKRFWSSSSSSSNRNRNRQLVAAVGVQ